MKALTLATCGLFMAASQPLWAQTPVLTVLTYDSFTSEWGPGPAIRAGFEAECGCELRMMPAGDGAALLSRLRLEGARSQADLVLGLDNNLIAAAKATDLFVPHGLETTFDLPQTWEDTTFLPFDWSWFAFIYDETRLPNPPTSFRELADSDLKIVIQDPRSSTPGLGLLMWVEAAYGAEAPQIWRDLADNLLTITPGWSESYDLFLKGEADMVLSYTTSPAYHISAEQDHAKHAAPFTEGHYMQIEVAGLLANAKQPELAKAFLKYLLSEKAQSTLPETNWMYPVKQLSGGLPESFSTLLTPQTSLLLSSSVAQESRDKALSYWRDALTQ